MPRKQRVLFADDLGMADNLFCYCRFNAATAWGNPKLRSAVIVGLYQSRVGSAHRIHRPTKRFGALTVGHFHPFRGVFALGGGALCEPAAKTAEWAAFAARRKPHQWWSLVGLVEALERIDGNVEEPGCLPLRKHGLVRQIF